VTACRIIRSGEEALVEHKVEYLEQTESSDPAAVSADSTSTTSAHAKKWA
jgi:hypothetical protein